MAKEVHLKVYDEKVFGPDQERGIAERDWRDPDVVLTLDGYRVYRKEEDGQPHWFLMHNETMRSIEIGAEPMEFFKRAHDEGRVLYGTLVARDEQRHN